MFNHIIYIAHILLEWYRIIDDILVIRLLLPLSTSWKEACDLVIFVPHYAWAQYVIYFQ